MAPDVGAVGMVCECFALCNLGYRRLSRAALWLECVPWYVGKAVLEGGFGSPLGVAEQLHVRTTAPKLYQC
jgi:hypothetical protein